MTRELKIVCAKFNKEDFKRALMQEELRIYCAKTDGRVDARIPQFIERIGGITVGKKKILEEDLRRKKFKHFKYIYIFFLIKKHTFLCSAKHT